MCPLIFTILNILLDINNTHLDLLYYSYHRSILILSNTVFKKQIATL